MAHEGSLTQTIGQCSRAPKKVGREHPVTIHLEGHVSELVALKDDADLLQHVGVVLAKAGRILEGAALGEITLHPSTERGLAKLIAGLASEATGRQRRITTKIYPEVQRCYATLEQIHQDARRGEIAA